MKNCKSLIAAILVLSLFGAVGASAQNLLTNPGFESGDLTGWTVTGGNASTSVTVESPDNGPALPGSNNAYMVNEGEAIGLTLKQTTAPGSAAGGVVNYSFDLKLDAAEVGGVLFVEIFAEGDGVGIVGGSGLLGPFWPWNAWETFTGSFVAPANTDFMTIQFMANTGAAIGTNCIAHVDNASIEIEGVVSNEASTWSNVKALYR
ncbi:MAG: hypothetical protein QNL91_12920 [Candidatus Krumholzibacteria bacterium]|nr:hypothetical protein [Candidatus Krumholzibacteria bacterium]